MKMRGWWVSEPRRGRLSLSVAVFCILDLRHDYGHGHTQKKTALARAILNGARVAMSTTLCYVVCAPVLAARKNTIPRQVLNILAAATTTVVSVKTEALNWP